MNLPAVHSIRHLLLKTAAVMAAVLTLAACARTGEDDALRPMQGAYDFGMFITIGDNQPVLRATPDDGTYDPGSGFENFIDLSAPLPDYRIYLFNANNRLIYAVPPADVQLIPTNNSHEGSKTYELKFSIDDVAPLGLNADACVFKMLMLANWRSYPTTLVTGSTTVDDLMNSAQAMNEYAAPATAVPGPDDRIPMFGINLYGPLKLTPGNLAVIERLHLLRAYSKIEVFNSPGSTAAIASVTLTRHNTRAYKAPVLDDYLQDEYVCGAYKDDYGRSFRPAPPGFETSEPLPFRRDGEDGSFILYVPEFRNTLDDGRSPRPGGERAVIRAAYTDETTGATHTYDIEFKYYDSANASRNGAAAGDHFDLRRNYWYRYELNRGKTDLVMRVDVVPYRDTTLNPGFGFDDPLPRPPSEWSVPPWVEITH